jgi:hypothetical protein
MNRRTSKIALLVGGALVAALPLALQAQQAPTTTSAMAVAPGKAVATETTKASAIVVGIEADPRILSLKLAKGRVVELVAGPEVKNFDQIKIGDEVHVEYVRALSLELKKEGTGIRQDSAKAAVASAPAGSKPAAAAAAHVSVLADVVAVNSKTHAVTLRGPKGNMVDIYVDDPEQLKNVKTGDQVQADYVEAMAVKVETVPKHAGK